MTARDRLIVALDYDSPEQAWQLVNSLGDTVCFYKVGLILFMAAGPGFVKELLAQGKRVFLDLKMADIDQTVRRATGHIPRGVAMTTIYGGKAAIKAACEGGGDDGPIILGVAWLSSMTAGETRDGADSSDIEKYVASYADEALQAGAGGLVASGSNVSLLKNRYLTREKKPIIVTPGIRPAASSTDEHKFVLSPAQAIAAGSDYLVVGRPITASAEPLVAAQQVLEEIETA